MQFHILILSDSGMDLDLIGFCFKLITNWYIYSASVGFLKKLINFESYRQNIFSLLITLFSQNNVNIHWNIKRKINQCRRLKLRISYKDHNTRNRLIISKLQSWENYKIYNQSILFYTRANLMSYNNWLYNK